MKWIYHLLFGFSIIACNAQTQEQTMDSTNAYNNLTEEEQRVILHKGTEYPNTGELTDNTASGTYICRQCNAALYTSKDKFDGHCGWPSFDDEIQGAVTRVPDADGMRTEIICSNCKGHLGHVFTGEGFTDKNVRHCVNSISMKFIQEGDSLPPILGPSPLSEQQNTDASSAFNFGEQAESISLATQDEMETIVLGAGCFWCIDAIFQELKGVEKVEVGYSGGAIKEPTYRMVCNGNTGHVEVAKITFNPKVISLEVLLDIFFHTHNPTTLNRQGADVGSQYRSVIFYQDSVQYKTAITVLESVDKSDLWSDKIVTTVEPLRNYYPAEDYHQNYYNNNTEQGYCSAVIGPKVAKFKKKYPELLR